MGFKNTVTWSGYTLTLSDLREFVTRTEDMSPALEVRVTVEPEFNCPTDRGGAIRLTASGE